MKTKIYCFGIFLALLSMSMNAHARWYGATTIAKGVGATHCSPDLYPDAVGPTSTDAIFPGTSGVEYPDGQTKVNRDLGSDIECMKWDSTKPILGADGAISGIWYKDLEPITLIAGDGGGSGLDGAYVRYRWNVANCLVGTPFSNDDVIDFPAEGINTLFLCARDGAGNTHFLQLPPYFYDATDPENTAITYPNGWSNNTTIPVEVSATDALSGIEQYEIQVSQSTDSPAFTTWSSWSIVATINTGDSPYRYDYPAVASTPGRAYKFRFRTKDYAGNWSNLTDNPALIYKLDTVVPDPDEFNPTAPTADGTHLIAHLNQEFTFSYGETGSPVSVTGNFERNSDPAQVDVVVIPTGVNKILNKNISNVPLSDVGINGGREITYTITNLTDAAGNTSVANRTFRWYVYADKDSTISVPETFIGTYVADGKANTWNIALKDQFLNFVIPATGINRTVNLSLTNISNTMFLNQYSRSGNRSVFINTPTYVENWLDASGSQPLGGQSSTTGVYPINIKVYTPTADSYGVGEHISDPAADFSFQPQFTITDDLTAEKVTAPDASPNFIYAPLFTTTLAGNLVDGGFIEGVEQNSIINVLENPLGFPNAVSSTSVNLDFSGTLDNISNFDFKADSTSPTTIYPYGTLTQFNISPAFPGTTNLNSRLTQKGGSIATPTSDLVLSSHLSYILDTKSIVTNSYVIGRDGGYHGNLVLSGLGTQVGVKILGSLSSNTVNELYTEQFQNGVSMFNGLNRGSIRQMIRKNVALAIRNSTGSTIVGTINSVAALPGVGLTATGRIISASINKSIMYIEDDGGNIDFTASSISGIRTLVIKGANLYIKNDMAYASPDSILGVVLHKNEAGQGGNLYIDPNITNIVGTYVIDGSIMSYDGTDVLGYQASIDDLKNQLYLFGSIVSENTIGGSKQDPPVCPSLITTCSNPPTMEEAQKYDLNYLRRYYLFDGEPFGGAKIIGGETCPAGACSTISTLPQKFILTTDPLAQYPFIIEFNPNILLTQPIGFENISD